MNFGGARMTPQAMDAVDAFLRASRFAENGGVMTDLDGTAVHEREGRVLVAMEVERGLKALAEQGRPVVLNTLRFPLNVVRTFGRAWSTVTDAPLPLASLNGAQTGWPVPGPGDTAVFEEIDAVPMDDDAIDEIDAAVRTLLAEGVSDLLVFHYPRDWTAGEVVWTPDPARMAALRRCYPSASEVFSGDVGRLRDRLTAREVCMAFLLVAIPQDRLMAYQHIRPSSFFTRAGVDKLAGARRLATRLGFDLAHSVGAGDTPMDSFLAGCGLAVHVGPLDVPHRGRIATLTAADPSALGAVLWRLARRPDGS